MEVPGIPGAIPTVSTEKTMAMNNAADALDKLANM